MSESTSLSIGPFELTGAPRRLRFGEASVDLGERALEVLAAIARRPDGVAAAELWPLASPEPQFDEDGLCDLVGDINTAIGRWSPDWFVAWFPEAAVPRFALVDATRRTGPIAALPARRTDIFGRDEAIDRVVAQLQAHRFVTILATGGMGKTTVALAAAHVAAAGHPDGVHIVDLAPVVDPDLVAQTVATAVGRAMRAVDPLTSLQQWARERRALIVLDSCEHVIDAAALVAETLVSAGAGIALLATSREPLRAAGEWLHRLAPLRLPPPGERVSAREAAQYPALRLFIERANAADPRFALRDEDVALLVSLCTRLDGIALAIEIVAARVDTLDLATLASQLEGRLLRLPGPRHAAPTRHHTLADLLDWSFQLLTGAEQQMLRRLSVFRGGFTIEAAIDVVADASTSAADVQDSMLDLIAKSLVAPVRSGEADRLRLLDTTRAYAGAKLDEAGERPQVQQRHARWLAAALEAAEGRWNRMTRAEWVDRHAPLIDDVRAALDGAFAPDGDVTLGAQLTLASFPLGRQMLLIDEFSRRVEHAVKRLEAITMAPDADVALNSLQMRLHFVVGCLGIRGNDRTPALASKLAHAGAMSPDAGSLDRFAAFNSMWADCVRRGDFQEAGHWADRLEGVAQSGSDPVAHLVAGRIQAQTLHFLGRHAQAAEAATRVIGEAWRTIPLVYNPSPVELRTSMRVVLARALWMQGFPDRAAAMARDAMEQARTDTPIARCQAIVMGSLVVALWSGRDDTAHELSAQLDDIEDIQGFSYWLRWGTRLREALALRSGGQAAADFSDEPDIVLADHLATMDERWLSATCIQRVAGGLIGWCAPEALRLQAERSLREATPAGLARGEALLQQSLDVARAQGAASWELRTATSLARHWASRERAPEARALLATVHARFTEGFASADWRAAAGLLETL